LRARFGLDGLRFGLGFRIVLEFRLDELRLRFGLGLGLGHLALFTAPE
jgi:hypothetical protein